MRTVEEEWLREKLRSDVESTSFRTVADRMGVSHVAIYRILQGSRVSDSVAKAMGYEAMPRRFRRVAGGAQA